MSHYYTEEECRAKAAELSVKQTDPKFDIELRLLKDDRGWYADVPTHTRGENAMVAGADRLCDRMAEGGSELIVRFRTIEDPERRPQVTLRRLVHRHGYGAEYLAFGASAIPFPIYLCDVTHDVMGSHERSVYVYSIDHN